jgi:hypothetical protein
MYYTRYVFTKKLLMEDETRSLERTPEVLGLLLCECEGDFGKDGGKNVRLPVVAPHGNLEVNTTVS